MTTKRWRYPETAVGRLRVDLAFAVASAAALFLLPPLLHKSLSYTVSYAVTWLVLFSALSLVRFLWRRRQGA